MAQVNPYLMFNGNCEAAFLFYKSVFGGEFQSFNRFGEMPQDDNCEPLDDTTKNLIMHVSFPISSETILMGSDTSESFGNTATIGNNISLSINTNSREEADKLFEGLSKDGKVTMPLQDTFWEAYFGMFTDKFGINWMINCDLGKR
jgi:PhnB protein